MWFYGEINFYDSAYLRYLLATVDRYGLGLRRAIKAENDVGSKTFTTSRYLVTIFFK